MSTAGRSGLIARSVSTKFAARLAAVPIGMITLGVCARYLGAEEYGALTSAVVFVGLFQFADLGVGTLVVRSAGGDADRLNRMVALSLSISLAVALPLTFGVLAAGATLYRSNAVTVTALLIVVWGLVLTSLGTCLSAVFEFHLRYRALVVGDIGGRAIALLMAVLVVRAGWGVVGVAAVQIVPAAVKCLVCVVGARRLVRLRPRWSMVEARNMVRASVPFAVVVMISAVHWRAPGVLLSALSAPQQVAGYGIALQIAGSLMMLPVAFSRSSLSTLSRHFAADRSAYQRAVRRSVELMLVLGLPIAVLGFPLAAPAITLITSTEFVGVTTGVLQLFFVASATGFLTGPVSAALIAAGKERRLAALSLGMLGLNVAVAAVLVPFLDAVGAGVGLVVSEAVGAVVAVCMLRPEVVRLVRFRFVAVLVLVNGACLALALALSGTPVALRAAILLSTYGALALVLPVVRDAVRSTVWRAPSRLTRRRAPSRRP